MKNFEMSLREFANRGEITTPYSIKSFGELLDFAKAFYPSIVDALYAYDYFGAYHF